MGSSLTFAKITYLTFNIECSKCKTVTSIDAGTYYSDQLYKESCIDCNNCGSEIRYKIDPPKITVIDCQHDYVSDRENVIMECTKCGNIIASG